VFDYDFQADMRRQLEGIHGKLNLIAGICIASASAGLGFLVWFTARARIGDALASILGFFVFLVVGKLIERPFRKYDA
jgi:hypothetical protein